MKHCNGCNSDLSLEAFSVDNSRRDGRNIRCRTCVRDAWRRKNVSTPCDGCGALSMNGDCWRCYRFEGLISGIEEEVFLIIPRLLWNARIVANRARRQAIARKHETRRFVKSLAAQRNLPPQARLKMLLEHVNGT